MAKSLLRTDNEIAEIYERHRLTVYRVCFAYMRNPADTEDAVQEAFYRLIKSGAPLTSEEHEKAWLIRTASNVCKNNLKHWWRRRENIEDYENLQSGGGVDTDGVLNAVLNLPDKYKTVVYLYYYEGYDSAEVAEILGKPPSTVRNYLHEARAILKRELGGNFDEE
jgi:RNA polymerase sigma-70 factor (ECF subfamily)